MLKSRLSERDTTKTEDLFSEMPVDTSQYSLETNQGE